MTADCEHQVDLTDYRWLAESSTQRLLDELAAERFDPLRLSNKLRKATTASRARLAVDLMELRSRARSKFTRADQMLFTRKGYQQATDEWIARYKARRFSEKGPVLDLCCGMGGDAIGLATESPLTAVDRCQSSAFCARHNLGVYVSENHQRFAVEAADIATIDPGNLAAWHIDPDRREGGRRASQLRSLQPGLDFLMPWASAHRDGAIKLAPATRLDDWPLDVEREWIGRGGECRQQVAWHGSLMKSPGMRRATLLTVSDSQPIRTIVGPPSPPVFGTMIGEYVYDVDSTVLAAGLVGTLAAEHNLTAWSASEGYLTGGSAGDAALSAFRVREVLPCRAGSVADWLKQRSIGVVEIKCRLAGFDLDRFRSKLRCRGDNQTTLLIAAQGARRVAVAAERVECDCTTEQR